DRRHLKPGCSGGTAGTAGAKAGGTPAPGHRWAGGSCRNSGDGAQMCDYSAADVGWLEDDSVGAVTGHLGRQIARVGIWNGDEIPIVGEQLAIRGPATQP